MKVLFLALSIIALPAEAIVNLEDLHTRDFEEGFTGALGLDLDGASGNSDMNTIHLNGQLHWQKALHSNIVLLSYSYGEANAQVNTDNAFAHLRHIQHIHSHYSWEVFTQLQNDHFARLSLRSLWGGGIRYKLSQGDNSYIYGVGTFYERERLSRQSSTYLEPTTSNDWRANLYMIVGHKLNEQSHLYATLYHQPKLQEAVDYRVLLQSGIKVVVATNLNLHVGIDIKYDSRPPTTVEDYDFNYRSGLEYRFD